MQRCCAAHLTGSLPVQLLPWPATAQDGQGPGHRRSIRPRRSAASRVSSLALGGCAALDPACAPCVAAVIDGAGKHELSVIASPRTCSRMATTSELLGSRPREHDDDLLDQTRMRASQLRRRARSGRRGVRAAGWPLWPLIQRTLRLSSTRSADADAPCGLEPSFTPDARAIPAQRVASRRSQGSFPLVATTTVGAIQLCRA